MGLRKGVKIDPHSGFPQGYVRGLDRAPQDLIPPQMQKIVGTPPPPSLSSKIHSFNIW